MPAAGGVPLAAWHLASTYSDMVERLTRAVEQPPDDIEWVTSDGIFIKQMLVKRAGTAVPQHSHAYDHTSMLASGSVDVWADGAPMGRYKAPHPILIKAGVKHLFLSLEDNTIVYCIHNLHGGEAVKILEEHDLLSEV